MDNNRITQNQYIFIVFSSMLGVGILSMAAGLCESAYQNGWISVLFGGLYPLFILTTSIIIDNKTNHADFWDICNKIYGKVLSYIFLIIFFIYFLTLFVTVATGYANVLTLSINSYLSPWCIILSVLILIMFISRLGLTMVGRVCEFYFYIALPLLAVTLFLIPKGSINNIKPVYFSFQEISKSVPSTLFAFAGCEVSYFIINKISNRKNTKKPTVIMVLFLVLIYLSNVFMVIYRLGWKLTSNLEYPLLYIIRTIEIPIISDFLSIVMLLWSVIILKTMLTNSFMSSCILSKLIKIDYKKASLLLLPIAFVYTFFMVPEYNSKAILDVVMPCFVIFSLAWGIITTILVSIKYKDCKNEVIKKQS